MEILILILILCCLLNASCVAVLCALNFLTKKSKKEIPQISEEEKRKREREARELQNFWNYNGEEQSR